MISTNVSKAINGIDLQKGLMYYGSFLKDSFYYVQEATSHVQIV